MPLVQLVRMSLLDDGGHLSVGNYVGMLQPLYRTGLVATLELSALVTGCAAILGYPVCYMISQLAPRWRGASLALVLLPFWTSTLVRTFAWLVILQRRGIVNSSLIKLGLIDQPLRLVNNFAGTAIGMTHIMLPFLILPLYSGMKAIDLDYLRAAATCGASPSRAFWQVYFPLTLPALGAGMILVFVMCLGFYLTPALLGGGKVLTWSMLIESALTINPNRGAASALGVALVAVTLLVLSVLRRLTRQDGMGVR